MANLVDIGLAYTVAEKPEDAIIHLEKALNVSSRHQCSRGTRITREESKRLVEGYRLLPAFHSVIPYLEQFVLLYPSSSESYFCLEDCFLATECIEQAAEHLERASHRSQPQLVQGYRWPGQM